MVYDLINARHVVLQTRNLFEAINVREVNEMTAALEQARRLAGADFSGPGSARLPADRPAHALRHVGPGKEIRIAFSRTSTGAAGARLPELGLGPMRQRTRRQAWHTRATSMGPFVTLSP